MKIAYVCADPGVPVFGSKGCSIHVQAVLKTLLEQGHQVELFAIRQGGEQPAYLEELTLHLLPSLPKGKTPAAISAREKAALSANLELRLGLESHGPFDVVYERYSLWSCTAMEYARTSNIPGILEVNAPLIEEQRTHRGLINLAEAEWITERVFTAASLLVAVSDEVAGYLNSYPGACGRVQVVANGVHPERYPADLQPALPKADDFVVGFVGSMKPWHDLSTLVTAFSHLYQHCPQARLLLVGDGPEREPIEQQLIEQGCYAVTQLTGRVDPASIPNLLAAMDVAVAPYALQEHCYFSPLKVYEAMAAGLPVVASAIGQMSQLIKTGENGILCPPGDAEALAVQLQSLAADPQQRSRIGQTARAQVLQEHTWEVVVETILDLAGLSPKSVVAVGDA